VQGKTVQLRVGLRGTLRGALWWWWWGGALWGGAASLYLIYKKTHAQTGTTGRGGA